MSKTFTIYLQSESIKKYQFELCSKYDREHDFDIIFGKVVSCRKLTLICQKYSNDVSRQVEMPGKSTIFVAPRTYLVGRHIFHVASHVTLHLNCDTLGHCKRRIFSLIITCKVLRHTAKCFTAFVCYIIKHLFPENQCSIPF